ncbi:hypothetical protein Bca101_101362 [Brassica carinata]
MSDSLVRISVLSWLFDARESSRRAAPSPPPPTRGGPLATLALKQPANSRRVRTGTPSPALRANPFPGYGSILPTSLPTLFHRPEAVHLGDLMRYEYDRRERTRSSGFSRAGMHRHHATRRCSSSRWTLPPLSRFRVGRLLNRKDNSFRIRRRLRLPNAAANRHAPVPNFNRSLSFAISAYQTICTDVARRLALLGFAATAALLLIEAWLLPRRPVSAQLGTVTRFRFIPHRQFCLPKMAHLELSIPWDGSTKQPPRPTYLKFENRSRTLRPDASNHWLYPIELASELQLSRGKLRGNQLLDGSISLSPLYPSQTNDLHARSPWPPPEFLWLRPPGIVHHLSVPTGMLTLNPSRKIKVGRLLLVRVSRRVEWGAHRPTPEHADAEARREARAADHDKAATPPLAELGPGPSLRTLPDYTNAKTPDFQAGLFPRPGILSSILANRAVTHGDQLPSDILERIGDDDFIDFATLFIDASRDIRCRVALDFTLQHRSNKHRLRLAKAGCLVECSLTLFVPGLVISEAMRIIQPNWAVTNDNHGIGRHEIS